MASEAPIAQTLRVELRNKIAEGSILPLPMSRRARGEIMVEIRAAMLVLPSRAGMRLPHLSTFDISELDHQVREILMETSGAALASIDPNQLASRDDQHGT